MTTDTIALLGIGIPLALNALAWAFQAGGYMFKIRNLERRMAACEKQASRASKGVVINSNRLKVLERDLGEQAHRVDPFDSAIDLQVFDPDTEESDDGDNQ